MHLSRSLSISACVSRRGVLDLLGSSTKKLESSESHGLENMQAIQPLRPGPLDSRFMSHFVEKHKPPSHSVSYFSSMDWTKGILEKKTHKLIPFYSRYLNEKNGESRFFAETINTSVGVPHVLGFCRKDLWPGRDTSGSGEDTEGTNSLEISRSTSSNTKTSSGKLDNADQFAKETVSDFMCLVHLGKGLEAHPGIVNGGFQSVIFDEVMYCAMLLHAHRDEFTPVRPKHYTLSLATKFVAPVKAGNDFLITASIASRQDRKWTIHGEIVNSEGTVLTRSESHWLTAKQPLS